MVAAAAYLLPFVPKQRVTFRSPHPVVAAWRRKSATSRARGQPSSLRTARSELLPLPAMPPGGLTARMTVRLPGGSVMIRAVIGGQDR
jgi:hypothetical protein